VNYTEAERSECLRKMSEASNQFYLAARLAGCHAFIEFAGLMNEYITCCDQAHKSGVDFHHLNGHGALLPMPDHSIDYVNEKLECIYGGRVGLIESQKTEGER